MNRSTSPDGLPGATATTPGPTVDDVVRSLRVLTRTGQDLVMDGSAVIEQELAMVISLAERLSEESIPSGTRERVRSGLLNRRIREDTHRVVDLVADVGGVVAAAGVQFIDTFVEPRRPAPAAEAAAAVEEPTVDGSDGADD
jgi:hypothetical protein